MAKEIICAFGVDVDAVAGWLGSYGGRGLPRRHLARACSPARSAPRGCWSCSAVTT